MHDLPKERGSNSMKMFTLPEIKIVKEMVQDNRSNLEIATKLNRSKSSIGNILARLGLTRPKGTNQFSFNKDAVNGMKGKNHTEETKRKIAATREKYVMERHPSWKGGKRKNDNGYVCIRIPDHPRSVNGYVFEHELIVESIFKRYLDKAEVVHHINEVKTDNRPNNLMLFRTSSEHTMYHAFMRREIEYYA